MDKRIGPEEHREIGNAIIRHVYEKEPPYYFLDIADEIKTKDGKNRENDEIQEVLSKLLQVRLHEGEVVDEQKRKLFLKKRLKEVKKLFDFDGMHPIKLTIFRKGEGFSQILKKDAGVPREGGEAVPSKEILDEGKLKNMLERLFPKEPDKTTLEGHEEMARAGKAGEGRNKLR